jgi:hypothetical protein
LLAQGKPGAAGGHGIQRTGMAHLALAGHPPRHPLRRVRSVLPACPRPESRKGNLAEAPPNWTCAFLSRAAGTGLGPGTGCCVGASIRPLVDPPGRSEFVDDALSHLAQAPSALRQPPGDGLHRRVSAPPGPRRSRAPRNPTSTVLLSRSKHCHHVGFAHPAKS